MNAGKSFCFFILTIVCCLPAFAFQASTLAARTPAPASSKVDPNNDDLDLHRSAAESYQLSGDLAHASLENRLIVALALIRLALIATRESQIDRSIEILSESISTYDTTRARTDLAGVYLQKGDFEKGIEQARAAVNLEPENGDAQETLGKLLYIKGDFATALPVLERILKLKPSFDGAYALGVTYLQLKQTERAKLLFEELTASVSNRPILHLMFGKAYDDTNYPADAEREYRKAIELDSKLSRAHFYLGYLILQNGGSQRLAEAGMEFEREISLTPNDAYSNFFVGVVASSVNDHAKAIRYLTTAIKLDPKMAASYLFLGQSQAELGDSAAAEKSLRKAIELTTDASKNSYEIRRAHFLLGRLLIKVGRRDEGEKELASARELQGQLLDSTRDELSRILGQVATSNPNTDRSNALSQIAASGGVPAATELARLKTTENQLKEIVAQAYHNLAVAAVQQGQIDDSLEKFSAAARWKSDFPGLDRNWGIVAFNAKQFDLATGPLSRQLKMKPQDALIRRMLAVSYYFTKQFAPAVETLKPMASTIANDPELSYFYGVSLVQLQRNKEASVVFANLAAQNRDLNQNKNQNQNQNQSSSDAHFYAGQGFVLAGDLNRALVEFQAVSTLDSTRTQAHYNAGQTLIRLNRLDEAETEFRKELEIDPENILAKYHLAYTLLERKSADDEALKLLREVVTAKYDYADARYQLGKVLIDKGELKEAIEQLETAANLDPTKDYIHYQLSIAYRKNSRTEDANRELKLYQQLKAKGRSESPAGMGTKKDVP